MIPSYLTYMFLILYQSVHPLTTTGLAPLFLLTTINFMLFLR